MKSFNELEPTPAFQSENVSEVPNRRLRILAVADIIPWPARDGYRLRFASVISALSDIGDIDLFVGVNPEDRGAPSNILRRFEAVVVPPAPVSLQLFIQTCVSRLPRRILWRNWDDARSRIREFVREPYDLVWYAHADSFEGIGDPSFGPAVVDLDNLEQNVLRPSLSFHPGSSSENGGAKRRRRPHGIHLLRWVLNWRDRILWSKLQQRIATLAASTLVCSADDQERLQALSVAVVPNSYADPGPPSKDIVAAPILVMVGLFTYEPNLVGARWFAYEVFPILQQLVPDVVVRLVGRNDERLRTSISVPGIEIVGEVDEISQELRGARGTFIPLLSGSGTRIKVLEALAYGLPVVSTSIGCEGLGIVPDVHALVHDDPKEFATACAQVLTDDETLLRLRGSGREFFLDNFEAGTVAARIQQIALDVATLNPAPSGEK